MRVLTDEQREMKRNRDREYRERNRVSINERSKITQQKRRDNGLEREYLSRPEVRQRRKELKTQYRRAAGALSRDELARRAAEKATAADARRLAKTDFLANFIGPPVPGKKSMTEAEYYAWRTRNFPEFYAKELDRAQRYKARTRTGYKDSIVKWAEMPQAVKEVKHLQYLISQTINRREHEIHQ